MESAAQLLLTLCEKCGGPWAVGVLLNSTSPSAMLHLHSTEVSRALLQQFRPQLSGESGRAVVDADDSTAEATIVAKHNPFLQLVLQDCIRHVENTGDGGWCFLYLVAAAFQQLRTDGLLKELRISPTKTALFIIRRWVQEALCPPSVSSSDHQWKDGKRGRRPQRVPWIGSVTVAHFERIAASMLSPRTVQWAALSPADSEHLASTVVSAFWAALDEGRNAVIPSRIRFCSAAGPILATRLVRGVVLDSKLPVEGSLLLSSSGNGCISGPLLLFSCSISAELPTTLRLLEKVVTKHKIAIVASQRVIDLVVRHRLLALGVMPLERLSIHSIQAVGKAAGATVIGNVLDLEEEDDDDEEGSLAVDAEGCCANQVQGWLGHASAEEFSLPGSKHILLKSIAPLPGAVGTTKATSAAAAGVYTLVVSCPTVTVQGALTMHIRRVLGTLFKLYGAPFVVPGGGGLELFLGEYIVHRWAVAGRLHRASEDERKKALRAKRQMFGVVLAVRRSFHGFFRKIVCGTRYNTFSLSNAALEELDPEVVARDLVSSSPSVSASNSVTSGFPGRTNLFRMCCYLEHGGAVAGMGPPPPPPPAASSPTSTSTNGGADEKGRDAAAKSPSCYFADDANWSFAGFDADRNTVTEVMSTKPADDCEVVIPVGSEKEVLRVLPLVSAADAVINAVSTLESILRVDNVVFRQGSAEDVGGDGCGTRFNVSFD